MTLSPEHQAIIIASAIADDVAQARGYRTITNAAELATMGFKSWQQTVPCLLQPQWNVKGAQAGHEIRPDVPRRKKNGDICKYDGPKDTPRILDVHPFAQQFLSRADVPLLLTEGTRKADAGLSYIRAAGTALCPVSLPGVWGGIIKKQLKPDWQHIALQGREVTFLFDSDSATNPKVQQALDTTARLLQARGAQCFQGVIPEAPGGGKQGLDDYLAAGAKLEDLFTARTPFATFAITLTWAFPDVLPCILPNVAPMPAEFLPPALRPWVTDMAVRQQVPLEFIAIPALIALATVVGRKIGIRPKQFDEGWLVIPNLWGAIVGRPGVQKSPALKAGLAPLDRLIATATERYKTLLIEGQAKLVAHEASVKAIKNAMDVAAKKPMPGQKTLAELTQDLIALEQNAPMIYTERRYKTNDSTIEKLGELFQQNPTGLLMFRDELSGWLRSLDKSGREGDREFFLEAWNGDGSFTVDRIGRGTIHIDALCLSLCGGIQPGKLQAYIADSVEGGSGDDGLMQRFQLLVWPDLDTQWTNVDRPSDGNAKNRAYAVYLALDELLPASLGASVSDDGIHFLTFASDAQAFFDTWRADLERRLRDGSIACMALEAHLAKYRSLMPSLALLFTLADLALHPVSPATVSHEAAILAADWCDFLEAHAKRAYAIVASPEISAAHTLAEYIKEGRVKDGDTVRSVYNHHWSGLNTPEKLSRALGMLEELHWVAVVDVSTGGRPSEIIHLNPDLGAIL